MWSLAQLGLQLCHIIAIAILVLASLPAPKVPNDFNSASTICSSYEHAPPAPNPAPWLPLPAPALKVTERDPPPRCLRACQVAGALRVAMVLPVGGATTPAAGARQGPLVLGGWGELRLWLGSGVG